MTLNVASNPAPGDGISLQAGTTLSGPGVTAGTKVVGGVGGAASGFGGSGAQAQGNYTITPSQTVTGPVTISYTTKTVVDCGLSGRIMGIVSCPVTSGGNSQGNAAFAISGMELLRRIDQQANSYWRVWNVVTGAQRRARRCRTDCAD